ncbi:hypothetical protein N7523_005740 [Penicillium sp. IBT 18751x]|nr:hypothetical protein N7523_005740 [Penicillium sp. IBT 18751x]
MPSNRHLPNLIYEIYQKFEDKLPYELNKWERNRFKGNCDRLFEKSGLKRKDRATKYRHQASHIMLKEMYKQMPSDLFVLSCLALSQTKITQLGSGGIEELLRWWEVVNHPPTLSALARNFASDNGLVYKEKGESASTEERTEVTNRANLSEEIEACQNPIADNMDDATQERSHVTNRVFSSEKIEPYLHPTGSTSDNPTTLAHRAVSLQKAELLRFLEFCGQDGQNNNINEEVDRDIHSLAHMMRQVPEPSALKISCSWDRPPSVEVSTTAMISVTISELFLRYFLAQ